MVVVRRETDRHVAAGRRELRGVTEQVPQNLLQPVGIAEHHARHVRRLNREVQALGIGRRPDALTRGEDDVAEIDAREPQPEPARNEA